jgi:hypothetical protein
VRRTSVALGGPIVTTVIDSIAVLNFSRSRTASSTAAEVHARRVSGQAGGRERGVVLTDLVEGVLHE